MSFLLKQLSPNNHDNIRIWFANKIKTSDEYLHRKRIERYSFGIPTCIIPSITFTG